MRTYWGIQGGEAPEVYNGADAKGKKVLYRIGFERVVKGEIKVVRSARKPKLVNNERKAVDVTTNESLFIEFVGKDGFAYAWHEFVSAL